MARPADAGEAHQRSEEPEGAGHGEPEEAAEPSTPDQAAEPSAPLSLPPLVWGIAVAGLVVRLAIAARPLQVPDRLFVPDDSYYTLAIARSIADGQGPTVDGSTLTSGFQPLLAFLMAPVYALTSSLDLPVRAALVLGAFVDSGSALLLGRLGWRIGGRVAAVVATGLWAVSPVAVGNALNGLETGLAVFLQLCVVELWWRARETGDARRYAVAGAFAGLAVLARVDSIFLLGAFAAIELLRPPRRPAVAGVLAAAAVVAPWGLYSTVQFGSPVPESGAAVRHIVSSFHGGISLPRSLGWAAGYLLGAPLADLSALRNFLLDRPRVSVLAWVAAAGAIATAAGWAWRRRPSLEPLLGLTLHGLAVLCLYTFWVPALWFFGRYLAAPQAMLTLLLALVASALWGRAQASARPALAAAGVLVAVVPAATTLGYLTADPDQTDDAGLHGAKGYRDVAREILALAPPGSVIGSLQSGALGYYAGDRVEVVNLDGVVDGEAADALRQRRLADYARRRGVTHLADWQFNVNNFLKVAGEPDLSAADLRLVGQARNQGADRFLLYEIDWPARRR